MQEQQEYESDDEAFVADEEGVLGEGDHVVAEYDEHDGACCTCSSTVYSSYLLRVLTSFVGMRTGKDYESDDDEDGAPEEQQEVADDAVQVFCQHTGVGCIVCGARSSRKHSVGA